MEPREQDAVVKPVERGIMFQSYEFSSREGVERFDSDLTGCAYIFGAGFGHISLVDAFDRHYAENRKAYYMILDLKLCLFNLLISTREIERMRGLRDIADTFCFYISWFGFVATYRAFYDKFMNLIVEICYPNQWKSFEGARSKRNKFRSIVESQPTAFAADLFIHLPEGFIKWMDSFIEMIDDQYRTT